jgi:hypothetical protein
VKIWTSILAAGAILAFAAPAGYSAIPWDTHSGPGHHVMRITHDTGPLSKQTATIKALRAENKALAAKLKALAAANKALRATIYANQRSGSNSGATGPASTESLVPALECASSADPVQTIDYPDNYDWSC